MIVATYIRPWSKSLFAYLSRGIFPNAKHVTFSDFPKIADHDIQTELNKRFYSRNFNEDDNLISEADKNDIIERCRLLRSVEKKDADKLVRAASKAIHDFVESAKPNIIFSVTIDSYILHITSIIAKNNGIKHLAIVPSFLPNSFRVSTLGEPVQTRKASNELLHNLLSKLKQDQYKPTYLTSKINTYQAYHQMLKNIARVLYFRAMRISKKRRLIYHYWSTEIVSKQILSFPKSFTKPNADWKCKAKNSGRILFYFPLQYAPECTVDYWPQNKSIIDYSEFVVSVSKELSKHGIVLIKEHPNLLGLRNSKLYKRLAKIENVILTPTNTHSNELINLSDILITVTGTAGFEAAIRGKSVITFGNPYYTTGMRFFAADWPSDLELITKRAIARNENPITEEEQIEMLRYVVEHSLEGTFINGPIFDPQSDSDKSHADSLIRSLSDFLKGIDYCPLIHQTR